jgi:hypothetical protein
MATGHRRRALRAQIEDTRTVEREAMKKYRKWRDKVYANSFAALRLLDLGYLPQGDHPFREGEAAFDLELPLRTRHGEQVFIAHVSTLEDLEEALQHWLAAITLPTRAREAQGQWDFSETEEKERLRVADQYLKRIFQNELPIEQRDALLRVVFQCDWFDIPPVKLRSYFQVVMTHAAGRSAKGNPVTLGGRPALSLDAPHDGRTLGDTLEDPRAQPDTADSDALWAELWRFSGVIPPSRPELRRMVALLLETRDEVEAVSLYGRGGAPQMKRLKAEIRLWKGKKGEKGA